MASSLRKPEVLSFEGNVPENLRIFFMEFDVYVDAAHPTATDATKIKIMLNLAGREAIERSRSFVFGENESTLQNWKAKFYQLCQPMKNLIILRHNFNTKQQKEGESFHAFLTGLRNQADACEFGDMKDELLRDRIVVGINNTKTKDLLFAEPNLSLQRAIEICELREGAEKAAQALKSEAEVTVVKMKKQGRRQHNSKEQVSKDSFKCKYCGYNHDKRRCPAFGKTCAKCGRRNHFAAMCKADEQQGSKGRSKVNELEYEDTEGRDISCDPDGNNFVIESVEIPKNNEINVTATFNRSTFDLKIDSGAKCNVISLETIKTLDTQEKIRIKSRDSVTLVSFSGDKTSTLGTCALPLQIAGQQATLQFQVVKFKKKTLLGLTDAIRLGLIKLHPEVHEVDEQHDNIPPDIHEKYGNLFSELPGTLPVTYKMKLRPDAQPVIRPPRRVPAARQEKVKQELEKMEENGIIKKVTQATEWVSSMVAAEKKNTDELRICIDPRDLNQALMRPHHALKTVDDILSDVSGAKVFSKLDAKSGFWHIRLDEKSSYYTTFNTPYGRYRFIKMPYGITSGSEVFQHAMEQLMEGYPCKIIVDDIIVYGKTREEHDRNLEQVMQRLQEINLHLNIKKCEFRVNSISFVGNVFTADGLQVDPEKVKAIREMPTPTCKQDVQRFLGMTNYLARYIEHHSDKTRALRSLTHNNVPFIWDANHEKEFNELKHDISSTPTLAYYDVSKPVTLTCDASKQGLGAACLQNGQPVAFASRVLAPNEQKWAQIEKELLAIVFACKKFNDYIYGKEVIIESDHKPLETIFKKQLEKAPARLQNMLLKLQKYNIKVVYKKGKEMYLADTLSRAYPSNTTTEEETFDYQVMTLETAATAISPPRYEELIDATANDDTLSKVSAIINHGNWPSKFNTAPSWLQPFYSFRDELAVEDGVVFRGAQIVIPVKLRSTYIQQLHKMHQSADSTLKLAKEYFYWPKMAEDIFYFVDQCSICNSAKPHQQKEPLKLHDVPSRPFEFVGTDLFDFNSKTFIVLVDSYSGFFEFQELSAPTSKNIIDFLKVQFATHGVPSKLISDNASYYVSQEFKNFTSKWNFTHITSSPNFPRSNGLSERAVRSAKELLRKCEKDHSDPRYALLLLRNTPRDNTLKSQAERLFSRKTNIALPTTEQVLQPRAPLRNIQNHLYNKRMIQKKYHDKTARPLTDLTTNQTVRLQTEKGHEKLGFIKSLTENPRSYIVNINGKDYRRNRQHLLPVAEKTPSGNPPIEPAITPPSRRPTYSEALKSTPISRDLKMTSLVSTNREGNGTQSTSSTGTEHSKPTPTPVTTRYGRVVKPPTRYTQ